MNEYYVYLHCKPDGTPFYVGKGTGSRLSKFGNRNAYHKNIVAKYGKDNILIGKISCSNDDVAFSLETGVIKCLHRMGVSLANLTDGGKGVPGRKLSEKSKSLIAKAKSGTKNHFFGKTGASCINFGKVKSQNGKYKGAINATFLETGQQFILEGRSEIDAAGFNATHVYACVKGIRKSHKGFSFERVLK